MKFIILTFNPGYINPKVLGNFETAFKLDHPDCKVYIIPHMDSNSKPLYCVQVVDTEKI